MLDGWYCRTINEQAMNIQNDHEDDVNAADADTSDDDDESQDGQDGGITNRNIDYKDQYTNLKKKLKFLLYENEFFQDSLKSSQRRLLKVTRDRSFLLDRLLQYEKPDLSSSESDDTESSDDSSKFENTRKRKLDMSGEVNRTSLIKNQNPPKRKRPPPKKQMQNISQIQQKQIGIGHQQNQIIVNHMLPDGHMTAEEVERHLQSRQSVLELVPEGELPNEMFNNNPSSESNDQMIETSPSNMGEECLSVDMNMMQE